MFNRICHTVSHTGERCVLMNRRQRSPMPYGSTVAPRDRFAHNWFAMAEAL
ncbi:hypothetical protein AB0952_21650 [Streptomyces caniferus]|uniref:hypothetical protein n=1 Tax=Streptomyces caniferus TaxID=285557 RepID=UPI003456375C